MSFTPVCPECLTRHRWGIVCASSEAFICEFCNSEIPITQLEVHEQTCAVINNILSPPLRRPRGSRGPRGIRRLRMPPAAQLRELEITIEGGFHEFMEIALLAQGELFTNLEVVRDLEAGARHRRGRRMRGARQTSYKYRQLEEQECTICLDRIKRGENVVCLPCTHIYHSDCIRDWIGTHSNCPVCRSTINN